MEQDNVMMNSMTRWSFVLLMGLLLCVSFGAQATAQDVPRLASSEGAWDEKAQEHRVRATLYALTAPDANSIKLGVLIEPDEHWHVYWKNSGESGLATGITWRATYADGSTWTSEEMTWPAPDVFLTSGVVTTFGYDEVLHTVALPWPKAEQLVPIEVTAHINYLTCEVECIPGDQVLGLDVSPQVAVSADVSDLFARYEPLLPVDAMQEGGPVEVSTRLSQSALRVGDEGIWRLSVVPCQMQDGEQVCLDWKPELADGAEHVFVPELADGVKLEVLNVVEPDAGNLDRVVIDVGWRVTATRPSEKEVQLAGVFRMRNEDNQRRAFRITGAYPLVGKDDPVKVFELEPLSVQVDDNEKVLGLKGDIQKEAPTLLYALWLAFVGGLLLNVMPCVFPVLSIKIAGVAQIAHHSRAKMLRHGLAYTLGILSAMGAMALAVIVMRQVGVEAGWGFQFQSPLFLLVLLGGLTLFAVNLFGAFDIGTPMGTQMQEVLQKGDGGELRQSFLEGLMCVLLATPCSAPFMGTAVGFALVSHGVIVAAIFMMLGLGLALPFVALCALPGWAKLLPKPGAWLDVLKHMLAMCLLVTCVWLLWLLGQGQGVDGMAMGLLWMCGLAGVGGIYGLVQYRAQGVKWSVIVALLMMIAASFALLTTQMDDPSEVAATPEEGARWQPFDEEAVARDVSEGKLVFVDFTADWCITCKVNENGVLLDEELLDEAERMGVVWYKADWTHRDDRIRAILKLHGKGGVPMYLIYGKNSPRDGQLLPELLTTQMILEGLERAR